MVEYLSTHPQVYMALKEMHHFGRDLHFGLRFYRRDRKAYLAEYANWNGQKCAGEACVWYLFSHTAAREIKAFSPDARIIIMLREPVEMLYSLYHQFTCDGNEQLPSFAEALAAQDDRRAGRRLSRLAYLPQGLAYRSVARYTEQVRRYFEVFGRDKVHVTIYDDFAADVTASYRQTLNFLGIDDHQLPETFAVVNGSKSVRSYALRAIMGDPFVRSRAISVSRRLGPAVFVRLRKMETWMWQLNTRPHRRTGLEPELRTQLKNEFVSEIERLSQLLRRDLTFWSLDQAPPSPAANTGLPREAHPLRYAER